MANRIKGITIEIGGDTTKLDKALSGTNKTLRDTQTQLKDVERLLKLDPGNTELLAQKQRLLAQSVETTTQKLDTLRKAAENADKALERGTAYQNAYDPLKRELDGVSASLRGLESNAESMRQKLADGEISTAQYDTFTQKLDDTRKRANELEQAIEAVNKEFAGAKIDQKQFDAIQRELAETEKAAENAQKKFEDFRISAEKFNASANKVSEGARKVQESTKGISTTAAGILGAAAATVPATEEFRTSMSVLETNAKNVRVSFESAKTALKNFNSVSGELDSSLEATSNLLQSGFTESNLQAAVENLAGAYLRFPDTLKIESLADSLQETLATGEATGQFGELLDRMGVGAENFTSQLAQIPDMADRINLALSTLDHEGLSDTYQAWKQNSEGLIESRDASFELQEAMAELAEKIQPILTDILKVITQLLDSFNSLPDGTQKAVGAFLLLAAGISPIAGLVKDVSDVLPGFIDLFEKLGVKGTIVGIAIGALALSLAMLVGAWDTMSGAEKVIAVLGFVTAAALTAAIALGAFQPALSLGIAAAGIVAGIAAIMIAINSATQRANQVAKQAQASVPGFAEGGVVPPNRPFLAVLGDNRSEPEVVSPVSTIEEAVARAMSSQPRNSGGIQSTRPLVVNLILDGQRFARVTVPYINAETTRAGVNIVKK